MSKVLHLPDWPATVVLPEPSRKRQANRLVRRRSPRGIRSGNPPREDKRNHLGRGKRAIGAHPQEGGSVEAARIESAYLESSGRKQPGKGTRAHRGFFTQKMRACGSCKQDRRGNGRKLLGRFGHTGQPGENRRQVIRGRREGRSNGNRDKAREQRVFDEILALFISPYFGFQKLFQYAIPHNFSSQPMEES